MFYFKTFTNLLKVCIFKFSTMVTPNNYNWQAFFILNIFHEITDDFKSFILVVQESNTCPYSIIINTDQIIPYLLPPTYLVFVGQNRFKCISSRGLLVKISFLLFKELLTCFPLAHDSQRRFSFNDMNDKTSHKVVFLQFRE